MTEDEHPPGPAGDAPGNPVVSDEGEAARWTAFGVERSLGDVRRAIRDALKRSTDGVSGFESSEGFVLQTIVDERQTACEVTLSSWSGGTQVHVTSPTEQHGVSYVLHDWLRRILNVRRDRNANRALARVRLRQRVRRRLSRLGTHALVTVGLAVVFGLVFWRPARIITEEPGTVVRRWGELVIRRQVNGTQPGKFRRGPFDYDVQLSNGSVLRTTLSELIPEGEHLWAAYSLRGPTSLGIDLYVRCGRTSCLEERRRSVEATLQAPRDAISSSTPSSSPTSRGFVR